MSNEGKFTLITVGLVLLVGLLFLSFGIIQSQELGVRYRLGRVIEEPVREGLYFKIPLVERVEKIDMRERTRTLSTDTISKEGLQFGITITVRYRVEDPINLTKNLQTQLNELIATYANSTIDDIASGRDKNELYSGEGREAIVSAVREKLNKELDGYAQINQVVFENLKLPESIVEAIEAQQAAIEKVKEKEHLKQVAQKEADIRRTEAKGIADANQIINQSLTPAYLQYEAIQKLNPDAQKVFVPSNNVLPTLEVNR